MKDTINRIEQKDKISLDVSKDYSFGKIFIFAYFCTAPFIYFFRALFLSTYILALLDVCLITSFFLLYAETVEKGHKIKSSILLVFFSSFFWALIITSILTSKFTSENFNLQLAFRYARIYGLNILFIYIAKYFNRADVNKLIKIIVVTGLIVSIYGVIQYFYGFFLFEKFYIATEEITAWRRSPELFNRFFSTMGSPNVFVTYSLILLWSSIYFAGQLKNKKKVILINIIMISLVLFNLYIGRMRLAFITLILTITIYFFLKRKKRYIFLILAIFLITLFALKDSLGGITNYFDPEDLAGSFNKRYFLLKNFVLPNVRLELPSGLGITFLYNKKIVLDNSYLNILILFGWIGLLVFGIFLISVIFRCIKLYTKNIQKNKKLILTTFMILLSILIMANGSSVLFNSVISAYLWFFVGIVLYWKK